MQLIPWFLLSSALTATTTTAASAYDNLHRWVPRHANGARAGGTCHISNFDQVGQIKTCQSVILQDLTVPAGRTLTLDLSEGAHLLFKGTTTFAYKQWDGPLMKVKGTNVTITAAPNAEINGNGPQYWDGKGGNGGQTKPKFCSGTHLINAHLVGLTIKNAPTQSFSLSNNQNLVLENITIDNRDGDKLGSNGKPVGHNTDGFDVSNSNGTYILNPTVYNQDDCLAINGGSDTYFSGGLCSGGHGISIGSVSQGKTVSGVHVQNSRIENSANAIRIKTVQDATEGSVSNVTYQNIALSNITNFGLMIEQDYSKKTGGPSGHPTAGIPITDVTISNVTGTVAKKASPINVVCAKGGCDGWNVSGFNVTGGKPSEKCQNVPKGIQY